MYCVIGEKILRCEVRKKEQLSSICKVSASKKEQSIANNRLFETEEAAAQFIKKRKLNKMNENKQVAHAVEVCKALYEKLYEETGIEVRTIDRQWTVNSAERHIIKLKRTLLDKPETHGKNVSKSFVSEKSYSDKKYSDRDKANGNRYGRNNAKGNMKNNTKNNTSRKYTNK